MSINSISSLLGGSSNGLSGSSTPINFSGVVSGLDTTSIINSLMALERRPLTNFNNQKAQIQARDQAYQDVKGKLTALQSALQSLMQSSAINVKSASVSAPSGSSTVLTATATSDAAAGAYAVNVTQLASSSSVGTSKPVSKGVNTTAVLNSSGMTTVPTAGTFTVNGVSISVDPTVNTLQSMVSKITDSSAGGTGGATGVTATIVNDANGNPNAIKLAPLNPAQAIQIGSGADTSNFLSAVRLVATNVAGGSIQSTQPLSAMTPGNALSAQPFNFSGTTTLASTGTLTINGTSIAWSNTDSLNTVLSRINGSAAGVRATYNAQTDTVSIMNTATGNQAVSLSESAPPAGQSGLLAALGLTGPNAVVTTGKTAQFTIATNGGTPGPVQYSNSNTATGVVPGLTLNLTATGASTVTVGQDSTTATNNIQSFISAFNTAIDTIENYTKIDLKTNKGSLLTGNPTIQGIESSLKSLMTTQANVPSGSTYKTIGDIGLSTGAYGSALYSTNHLVLDTGKLSTALQTNASAVFGVLSGLVATTSITNASGSPISTGTSWLQSVSGLPSGNATSGRYQITYTPSATNNLSATFLSNTGSGAPLTGLIAAGGTSSVVPGMVLSAKSAPVAGTEYVNYTVSSAGVLQGVNNYLSQMLAPGGAFDAESQSAASQSKSIDSQIASLNARLALKQQTLQNQFTKMEVALAKLQQQGASLSSKLSASTN
jgi:flagellar hook-associated protein 2